MKKALSVIVPAYNVSAYIKTALDSILKAKKAVEAVEVIVVNDGSTDDTLQIVEKYSNNYPETIRVINKVNGGHGSGINVGLRSSEGLYIKILDGDDWFDQKGLERLVDYIIKEDEKPDLIINPYERIWENGKKQITEYLQGSGQSHQDFSVVNSNNYTLSLHSITIRKSLFSENDIPCIDENISYDDMEYILYPVPYVKTIVFLEDIVYQYRFGTADQSMNPLQMVKKLSMHTKVISSLDNYYQKTKDQFDEEQKRYYLREYVDTIGTNCYLRIKSNQKYAEIRDFLLQYHNYPLSQTGMTQMRLVLKYKRFGYLLCRIRNLFA